MLPRLIQGGMGAGVSGWRLAREVAALGQLGVVSGTALDTLLVRRLWAGDAGGHLRRALEAFPAQSIAQRVLSRYWRKPGGVDAHAAYPLLALPGARLSVERERLLVAANFVEVYLAKEGLGSGGESGGVGGSGGKVGINYLHKIQFPLLASLYGAMLAGVDVVLMGAGVPWEIPGVLGLLAQHKEATIALDLTGGDEHDAQLSFDPRAMWQMEGPDPLPELTRPKFLAIVSSVVLAKALIKRSAGGMDGFVVEAPTAGGHNAPPRGPQQLSATGEPIYGPRDDADPAQMRELGLPFWLAGGYASKDKLQSAMAAGAHGVQVGTAFAFCEESGLDPHLRQRFVDAAVEHKTSVFTDPSASPTSFPFKVAALEGTLSERDVYSQRPRICDLGYLRRAYRKPDGTIGYRCPGEPVDDYLRKGGTIEETVGRKCLCNALVANVGMPQVRKDGYEEPAMLTAGNDLECIEHFVDAQRRTYHARDVVEAILGGV